MYIHTQQPCACHLSTLHRYWYGMVYLDPPNHPPSLRNIHHWLQRIGREGFFKVCGHQQVLCGEGGACWASRCRKIFALLTGKLT